MPHLDAIGVVVSDMRASVRFYRLLGLDFPDDPGEDDDHVEATTPGGLRVMLDTEELVKGFMPDWTRPATHSMGLAFLCDSPDDVNRTHQSLVAAGYRSKTDPWDAFWGQRYAQILDPDGHAVDLFANL